MVHGGSGRPSLSGLWLAGVRGGVSAEAVGQHLLSLSVQAQLKSVGKSFKSYISELRAWRAFVHMRGVPGLPASERSVLEYLGIFRNGRSAAQYVAALRFLHDVCMLSREGTDAKSVKRTLLGLTKATPPCKRAHAIPPEHSAELAATASARGDPDFALMATLSSAFLFRVASEMLGLEFKGEHSVCRLVTVDGRRALRVELASRKNAPNGAVLTRPCTCPEGSVRPDSCPVHALARWCSVTKRQPTGGRLFVMSPQQATRKLRAYAKLCGFAYAEEACLHGFRRGRAQWLARSRKPLSVILKAGGWGSAAFLSYLEHDEITEGAFLDLLLEEDEQTESA
jgi:hypothetical protein